jgi:hypothetical protein
MPHIPSTHPRSFRPIRGEKFKSRYSGHLSSRLAEIGHNMTKQSGFPYTWKEAKLRAIQSVFTTFVLNVFIHWKLFNPCLLHLFWKFSFCFSSSVLCWVKIESHSIRVHYICFECFHSLKTVQSVFITFVLKVLILLLISGWNTSVLYWVRLVFGLNAKSSLWMNTVSFFMKWTIP